MLGWLYVAEATFPLTETWFAESRMWFTAAIPPDFRTDISAAPYGILGDDMLPVVKCPDPINVDMRTVGALGGQVTVSFAFEDFLATKGPKERCPTCGFLRPVKT